MGLFTTVVVLWLTSTAHSLPSTGQASNFNLTSELATTYGCNQSCQAIFALTNAADLENLGTAFDFDFYATSHNFSSSAPGDLLKFQPIDSTGLNIPDGIAAYRFQYTSQDNDGNPVPSTGFMAFPFTKPALGGKFPLVAYAHGTIGVYRGCAPSSSPNFFDYDSWSPLLLRGYAIVGTDYAGLGNNYTTHKYLSYKSHANDLYYSVQAARKAFPETYTDEWMSIGHSQGAGAVWKLSEHPLVQNASSGYLGTVGVSPGAKLYDMVQVIFDTIFPRPDFHQFVVSAESGMLVYGITQAFPNYTAPWIGDNWRQRIALATELQSCTLTSMGMSFDLHRDQLISPNVSVSADTILKQFQATNAPAQGDPASKPIMIVQGWNDTSLLPESTALAVKDAVAAGNEVHFVRYPGLDHSATIAASAPDWLKFIDDRFACKTSGGGSTDQTVVPFDLAVAKTPLELPTDQEPLLSLLG